MKQKSLREAFEHFLAKRDVFLTPEQERRTDSKAILLAHQLYESNREDYYLLKDRHIVG